MIVKTKQVVSFKEKVERIVKSIPKGTVMTYKEVAKRTGRPRASRAVGNIMARNKSVDIPCHRVIRTDGMIGGYNGLRGEKEALLRSEGYKI